MIAEILRFDGETVLPNQRHIVSIAAELIENKRTLEELVMPVTCDALTDQTDEYEKSQ